VHDDDFDMALPRARALIARLEEKPHVNPTLQQRSSHSEIRTGITSRSVRSLRPNPQMQPTDRAGPELLVVAALLVAKPPKR
jgi:hypothetical protein